MSGNKDNKGFTPINVKKEMLEAQTRIPILRVPIVTGNNKSVVPIEPTNRPDLNEADVITRYGEPLIPESVKAGAIDVNAADLGAVNGPHLGLDSIVDSARKIPEIINKTSTTRLLAGTIIHRPSMGGSDYFPTNETTLQLTNEQRELLEGIPEADVQMSPLALLAVVNAVLSRMTTEYNIDNRQTALTTVYSLGIQTPKEYLTDPNNLHRILKELNLPVNTPFGESLIKINELMQNRKFTDQLNGLEFQVKIQSSSLSEILFLLNNIYFHLQGNNATDNPANEMSELARVARGNIRTLNIPPDENSLLQDVLSLIELPNNTK